MLPADDLLAPDAIRDPHSFFLRLREHDPVFWSPRHKVFILTSHREVDRAFRDKTLSSARAMASFRQKLSIRHTELLTHAMALLDGWMLLNDPPDHTRLRDPVRRSFTPAATDALIPRITARVDRLLDELGDEADIVGDFAQPLTAMVICDLLGIDVGEREFLRQWTRDFGQLIYGASSHNPDYAETVARAGDAFFARLRPTAAAKRTAPCNDLMSHLLATSHAEAWTEAELLGTCSMLLFAGHDTTSALIASSTRALLQHPEALARFVHEPDLTTSAIEEFLRFDGPSKNFVRVATATHERGGHEIAAGAHLWLAILGANQDPAVFENPASLLLDRDPNPHISFGAGIHFCVGAALARTEARIALPRLFARYPKLKLATRDHQWSTTIVDRTLLSLPVITH
ncbi:MAG: cytochrome P450 [Gammaproteobacteria bacterium]|nr:cytochrome P450 [Gammaproteobacteria bacterium]